MISYDVPKLLLDTTRGDLEISKQHFNTTWDTHKPPNRRNLRQEQRKALKLHCFPNAYAYLTSEVRNYFRMNVKIQNLLLDLRQLV